jgi:hypothetical protein
MHSNKFGWPGKPFQIWTSENFYNVHATWYIYVNWKPLCDSNITSLSHKQHHFSWTPTSGILIQFKLTAKMIYRDELLVTNTDNNLLCILITTMQQQQIPASPAIKF